MKDDARICLGGFREQGVDMKVLLGAGRMRRTEVVKCELIMVIYASWKKGRLGHSLCSPPQHTKRRVSFIHTRNLAASEVNTEVKSRSPCHLFFGQFDIFTTAGGIDNCIPYFRLLDISESLTSSTPLSS